MGVRVAMRGDGWGLEVEVRMKVRMGWGMLRVGGGRLGARGWHAGILACAIIPGVNHQW